MHDLEALAERVEKASGPDRGDWEMGAEYWLDHAARGPALKSLGKPCHDCAVVTGFYESLAEDLSRQSREVIEQVCGNWFCHNHGNRACAGNIAYQAARATLSQPMEDDRGTR